MIIRIGRGATLDALLDELTDLAATAPPTGDFFRAILDAAIHTTNAQAGAVWSVVNVKYRLEQEVGLVRLGIGSNPQLQLLHEDALESSSKEQLPGGNATSGIELTAKSLDGKTYRFFGCRDHSFAYLVIELVHDANSPVDQDLIGRVMAALSEIARDFRNAMTLKRLQRQDNVWNDFQSVLPKLHASIRLAETAFQLANEGRKFLKCDRLIVARSDQGKSQILAVSGVATIERRSKQIRELESLVTVVMRSGVSLRFPTTDEEPPQRSESLQRYLDTSGCNRIWVRLLQRNEPSIDPSDASDLSNAGTNEPFGALIIEYFENSEEADLDERSSLLLLHGGIALKNALEYDRLPLLHVSQKLNAIPGLYRSQRWRALFVVAMLSALIALAIFVPSDLNIDAKGIIQPVALHHLFAPANGEIIQVLASHQGTVRNGEVLVVVRSREIELRKEELLTQRATSQEKLRGIEAARLRNRKPSSAESISLAELSANEREIKEVLASQNVQLSILTEMLSSLAIKSPIDGQVISWDPSETLDQRPVQQGQKLLSVAPLDGLGRLKLRVLDEDSRHVIHAMQQKDKPLKVTFSIASDPGAKHAAIVSQIGTIVETLSDEGASVRVDATVESAEMKNARPGAIVIAKIHCGTTSIGYVWTRRLWDTLQLRFF